MRQALKLHPDSCCDALTGIVVEVARHRGHLLLRYVVAGNIGNLRLPSVRRPARANDLWQHTCFEVFIRLRPSEAYFEFNFAPSLQWAANAFSSCRTGMRVAHEIDAPCFESKSEGGVYELKISLELGRLPGLTRDSTWNLGLAAVIEETNNRKSYWALEHAPGVANFHHSDCFALELPATLQP